MNLSIENILQTFSNHEDELNRLYDKHINEPVRRSFGYVAHPLLSSEENMHFTLNLISEKRLQI